MSTQTTDSKTNVPSAEETELKILRQYLDALGVQYKKSQGLETLRELFTDNSVKISEGKTKEKDIQEITKEALKLVRCIITSNLAQDTNKHGEIFSVGNRYFSVTRFVPFQSPTHIETSLLEFIKGKQIINSKVEKGIGGRDKIVEQKGQMYNIQILPPLTEEEFNDLKTMQLKDPEFLNKDGV
jgi:hypothetical protein